MTTLATNDVDAKRTPPMPKNESTFTYSNDVELRVERTFNAPPRIVFTAWTRADLIKQWWAPTSHGVVISAASSDVRVGGDYRYVMRQSDGSEQGFSGTYSEVTPHTKLAYTQIFEPMAHAGAVQVSVTFEERPGGKTHLVSREIYPSKEALAAAVECGMEHGAREIMDQLDELVPTLELA